MQSERHRECALLNANCLSDLLSIMLFLPWVVVDAGLSGDDGALPAGKGLDLWAW